MQSQTTFAQEGQPASTFIVDRKMAKAGKEEFLWNRCPVCHTIGKGRLMAPDLAGVVGRRQTEWIRRFLKDPVAMLASDSIAQQMLEEYGGMTMPDLNLSDGQIEALIHYLADEGQKKVKKK